MLNVLVEVQQQTDEKQPDSEGPELLTGVRQNLDPSLKLTLPGR